MRTLICLIILAIHVAFVALIYRIVLHTANMLDESMFWSTRPLDGFWLEHIGAIVLAPFAVAGVSYLRHLRRRNWFETAALHATINVTMLSFGPLAFGFLALNLFAPFIILGTLTGLTLVVCCLLIWGSAVLLLG